jgi:hypothetical protein
MRLCNNECKTLIRCIRCDKQLCQPVDQQNPDTIVQQHCTTEGFYNLEEGKVCIHCHVAGSTSFGPSKKNEKQSSS